MAKAAKKAAPKVARLASGTVRVDLKAGVSAKTIHSLLDEIFKLNGCLTCGLGGIDILLRPLELSQPGITIAQFEGVKGISVGR